MINCDMLQRTNPTPEARGGSREDQPHVQGAVGCAGSGGPSGTIPRWRSGRVVVRRYPSSKVRSSGCALLDSCEEIPHIQGKRNPSKMVGVARGIHRADTLKPYTQKTSQSNHTRTTALSNSMKLSHARGATQDGRVMVEGSDRMWSTGEGNGKPLQYSWFENPTNSMKRKNHGFGLHIDLCWEIDVSAF